MADDLKRVVVWKNLLLNGTDYCGLWHTAEGWLLKGTVIGVLKGQRPMQANYEIYCDENWLTHRVQIERTIGSDVKSLGLSVESRGAWRSSGQEIRDIHGCDDIDLAVTPATGCNRNSSNDNSGGTTPLLTSGNELEGHHDAGSRPVSSGTHHEHCSSHESRDN